MVASRVLALLCRAARLDLILRVRLCLPLLVRVRYDLILAPLLLGYLQIPGAVTNPELLTEKTRNNLNEFVNRMKTALAALI